MISHPETSGETFDKWSITQLGIVWLCWDFLYRCAIGPCRSQNCKKSTSIKSKMAGGA